ncbi:M28 family peptidase [Sulfitobacter sp. F26204]|uniref:M28 family peptidase n=1 Tax=Sulfitobacter sp. F26204 TaxID=2996014 RepID=UPI00225DE997|nr:M28 family peptidase [Sulfitobacter sp. F26204]MCX7561464.1 M28 family peptidase [Sulfitobacter sp. F26204]
MINKQLLATAFVAGIGMCECAAAQGDMTSLLAFDRTIVTTLDAKLAFEHIRYLSQEIGSRPSGTTAERRAAEYLADYYEKIGLEVTIQPYAAYDLSIGNITVHGAHNFFGKGDSGFAEYHGMVWETGAAPNGAFTGDAGITAQVINVGIGAAGAFDETAKGNIALMEKSPDITQDEQVTNAKNAGAAAVIIYNNLGTKGNLGGTFFPDIEAVDIPVIGAAKAHGLWLIEMLESGPVSVELQNWFLDDTTSQNVIATKRGANSDVPIVAILAHYDTKLGAPGAWDNASGTSVVMEIARVLKRYNTEHVELRFIGMGSEEYGGHAGATYYTQNLSKSELARFAGAINIDGIGVNHEASKKLFARSADGMINGLMQSAMASAVRLGFPDLLLGKSTFSDHEQFHEVGIPAVMFTTLAAEGGSGHYHSGAYNLTPYYHSPQDTFEENVLIERLEIDLNMIAASVYDYIRKLEDVPTSRK